MAAAFGGKGDPTFEFDEGPIPSRKRMSERLTDIGVDDRLDLDRTSR
jgi:hypothetical protein